MLRIWGAANVQAQLNVVSRKKVYVTGSAKTCLDAGIFENHFLAFYNSVMQGDYNALCFTSVACSVAKLRAPPFPCSAEERLE